VFREFYLGLLKKNMQPEMARLTLARKIAAITLKILEEGRSVRRGTYEVTSSLSAWRVRWRAEFIADSNGN